MSIDELILGADITLGEADVSACRSLQCTASLPVMVNCIILAVANALNDCHISGIGGPCGGTVFPPRVCAPGLVCQRYGLPDVGGICVVPVSTPTSTPAPTPVLYHGHTCCECGNSACTDFVWVEIEPVCPVGCQTFTDAECEAPCHGGPQTARATGVSLTPCTADADCDDGNVCTVDGCTIDGCTHACVCV